MTTPLEDRLIRCWRNNKTMLTIYGTGLMVAGLTTDLTYDRQVEKYDRLQAEAFAAVDRNAATHGGLFVGQLNAHERAEDEPIVEAPQTLAPDDAKEQITNYLAGKAEWKTAYFGVVAFVACSLIGSLGAEFIGAKKRLRDELGLKPR